MRAQVTAGVRRTGISFLRGIKVLGVRGGGPPNRITEIPEKPADRGIGTATSMSCLFGEGDTDSRVPKLAVGLVNG
jgi:hypothetical protein